MCAVRKAVFQTDEAETLSVHLTASNMRVPSHVLGEGGDNNKYLTHATIKPHQGLQISQRLIRCGRYAMRTTELKFDYGMYSGKR